MPYGGWGPPAIDPGTISGILDPYIARQKELRTGASLAAGFDALQKGDYSGMAKIMQSLAADNPTLATHLLTVYETEQSRKREEARFAAQQKQAADLGWAHLYQAGQIPHPADAGDVEFGGGKGYVTPGMPPWAPAPYGPGASPAPPAPTPAPIPATSGQPQPAVVQPPPTPQQPPIGGSPAGPVAQAGQEPPAPAPEPAAAPAPAARQPAGGADIQKAIELYRTAGLRGAELEQALPQGIRETARQVADYYKPLSDFVRRGQSGPDLRLLYSKLAEAIDPTYREANYPIVAKHLAGYATTTGTSPGARLYNLNTAAGHLESMDKLNAELSKGKFDIPVLNSIYQKLNVALGQGVDVTNWNMMRQLVAPELAKVIGGAGGLGVEERVRLANSIAASASPAQAIGALAQVKGAMAERYAVAHQQFNNETFEKRPFEFARKLSGNSMRIMLEKEGVNVSDVTARNLGMLLKNKDNKEKLAEFDAAFGGGRAQEIIDGLR